MIRWISLFQILLLFSVFSESAEDMRGSFDDGYLVFKSSDMNYQIKMDGRVMLDFGFIDADENKQLTADTDYRRLRFALKTVLYKTWATEFDLDFEGNEVEAKDMWLAYIGIPNWNFKIGNHKPTFSVAEVTTSRWYTFVDAPNVIEAFATGRRIGFSTSYWNNHVYLGATFFGDEPDVNGSDVDADDQGESEHFGYAVRGVIRPLSWQSNDDLEHVLHIGINLLNHSPQSEDEDEFEYDVRLENRVADYKFLKTGDLENVDDVDTQGIEVLYKNHQFMVQAEYLTSEVNFRDTTPEYESDGYYIQTSYFFRGVGRGYGLDDAEFGAVKPTHPNGDFEIALRYSVLDLNDPGAGVLGGESKILTLGFNWYANTNLLFRFNYILADLDENADGDGDFVGGDDVDMGVLRIQFMF